MLCLLAECSNMEHGRHCELGQSPDVMRKTVCNPALQSATGGPLEKKRKDYAFRRQFNKKPSVIAGCPGVGRLLVLLNTAVSFLSGCEPVTASQHSFYLQFFLFAAAACLRLLMQLRLCLATWLPLHALFTYLCHLTGSPLQRAVFKCSCVAQCKDCFGGQMQ